MDAPEDWGSPVSNDVSWERLQSILEHLRYAAEQIDKGEEEHLANVELLSVREEEHEANVLRLTTNEAAILSNRNALTALTARVATLEANYVTDHASLVTVQTRLGLVNALLHLW